MRAADTSSGAARHLPLKGKAGGIRADTSRTCAGCAEIRDEPWAGERQIAHRCMAEGPQQGRVVGFDKAWNNLIPAWCVKRADGGGLREPERYESRSAIHPGAMDAPKQATKAAANVRWRQMREALEREMNTSSGAARHLPLKGKAE